MIWQDFVIAAGQMFFSLALLPALTGPQKPPVSMCVMTTVALLGFSIAYASLNMWGAMVSVLICALGWFWLAKQQRFGRK